jgi:pimeloyl-ACP methyl ester carboxylesterase
VASLIAIVGLVTGGMIVVSITYFDRDMATVWRAGFVEKQVTINSGHGFHFEKPSDFSQILVDFKERMDD